ncbi:MAG: hypothetical protein CVT77_17955 [Alphaproteobacteria bacterium HGW-Alphaproteobacteria-16]|nr:MAG: hypothetical protein CVT77_17955 [Alphaproteobacteria bacterium HGW-Alphaproteobacteria-16]
MRCYACRAGEGFLVIEPSMRGPSRRYETSLDRVGFALATGGALGGVVVLLLVVAAGQRDPGGLLASWALGTVFTTLGITAVAAPIWFALHLAGYRRAWHAAMIGAAIAMILFVAGQTYGFGFLEAPPSDGRTLLYRWLSALATSGLLAIVSAGIAVAMWRVAYRPTGKG